MGDSESDELVDRNKVPICYTANVTDDWTSLSTTI